MSCQIADVRMNIYDEEEIIEGCTVQILRNSVTGDCSIGWWKGTAADMPVVKRQEGDDV